jgi:hypothetical protein
MTVGELRAVIESLPDDMPIASHDVGGYLDWEFCGAEVIDPATVKSEYPQPDVPYLYIAS